jgi:hypothetical protein
VNRLGSARWLWPAAALITGACVVSQNFDDAKFRCDPKGGPDECPSDMVCGGDGLCRHSSAKIDGSAGVGGDSGGDSCFPNTCDKLAPACGEIDDGCGHTLSCGCTAPDTCGGGELLGQCGCHAQASVERSGDAAFQVPASGSVAWNNPDNALKSDDQYADTASAMAAGKVTHELKVSAFGFALPQNAAVTGVGVRIERSSANGAIKDQAVRVQVGGKPLATPQSKSAAWGTSDGDVSYGGDGELWGATQITRAQVDASDFGVSLTATATASDTPHVDAVWMTVFYTNPDCPTP